VISGLSDFCALRTRERILTVLKGWHRRLRLLVASWFGWVSRLCRIARWPTGLSPTNPWLPAVLCLPFVLQRRTLPSRLLRSVCHQLGGLHQRFATGLYRPFPDCAPTPAAYSKANRHYHLCRATPLSEGYSEHQLRTLPRNPCPNQSFFECQMKHCSIIEIVFCVWVFVRITLVS